MGNISDLIGGEFDSGQYDAPNDYSALPPGDYTMVVEKADVKPTKAGDGHYVNVQLSVVGNNYANRKAFDRMNIDNQSQKAVEIGLRQLSALCKAAAGGQDVRITDTDQLIGQVVLVKLAVKDDQNVVKSYKPAGTQYDTPPTGKAATTVQRPTKDVVQPPAGFPGRPSSTPQVAAPTQPQSGAVVPPWKR